MTNIVSLTLSPSLDCSSETTTIFPEGKIRCDSPLFEPGGGGINVTRVISRLGGNSTAVFPCGGSTGEYLNQLLKKAGVRTLPVSSRQWTRQNLNIVTRCDQKQYRFIMPGADLSTDELREIASAVLGQKADYLVISGSVPDNVSSDFILDLVNKCGRQNIKVVFDCSGEALSRVVNESELFLIKPNARELASLSGAEFERAGDLVDQARKLIDRGNIEVILVSLGAQGALLVSGDVCEQIIPPSVNTCSTVGAGDSMLAAVIHAISQGFSYREAARYGVAAGTAATMNRGTQLCDPSVMEDIYSWLMEQQPIVDQ